MELLSKAMQYFFKGGNEESPSEIIQKLVSPLGFCVLKAYNIEGMNCVNPLFGENIKYP